MNDYESAIETIKHICPLANIKDTDYDLAIKALKKQILKKVTHDGFCPICKTQYPMYPPSLNKYCSNCGQKLDWD